MAKRWPIIQKISPMVILYIIGLAAGNTFLSGDTVTQLCTNISNVVVLMSIPLMLMGCNFKMWSTKAVVKTFLVGVFSVLCVTLIGFFLFRTMAFNAQVSNTNYAKISAVMTGIYIGGIPNLAPISKAVGLPQHLFLMVSGYDLIVTGLYLILIVFFGEPIIRRIFKINGDLVLVSSIALINSPPFVPMVAAILNNKDIILPGIAIGLLGYAVGNYLGIGIFTLLS